MKINVKDVEGNRVWAERNGLQSAFSTRTKLNLPCWSTWGYCSYHSFGLDRLIILVYAACKNWRAASFQDALRTPELWTCKYCFPDVGSCKHHFTLGASPSFNGAIPPWSRWWTSHGQAAAHPGAFFQRYTTVSGLDGKLKYEPLVCAAPWTHLTPTARSVWGVDLISWR